MSSGRSRKRSKVAGGARKVGLKPVKPTVGLKPVKKTPSTPTTPRYVSEIRNILALLMKNKASMPFKQVPAAPDYRSLLKDALCLNVMQAKAARNPCGYSNFKEFDNDMKLLHRQEMKYDNKVSSALSAKRKSRMEILKGYYDTLSRSYLAHGPNLSPNTKTTSSAGGGKANSASTSMTTTTTSVTTVSSTISTSTNTNSGSTQAAPGSVKKIKAPKTTTNAATRKKSGKGAVINLTDDSPPAEAPIATKKTTLAGRKRNLSNQMKEETKEDKPPQKKLRLSDAKSVLNKVKTTVTSNVTKAKTKLKAKTQKMEESKHIEIDEPLTQPPSQPSQTSTQEEDVKMSEVTSTKTTRQSAFGSGALSTPVSRAGFSFETPSSTKSAKTKSRKKKTNVNVPATFLEMASSYAMMSSGKNGAAGSSSTRKTKSSTTTTTTTTVTTSSSSSSSSRTTSLLDSIKKNTRQPTSSFTQKFSLDSVKTRNEKKPGNSRILKDTVVATNRGKEEMDVDAISDSDLPPRFQGGYGGGGFESAMRMVSRGDYSFGDVPYTPKTTVRSYTFSDDDGDDVHGTNNMSSFANRFTSSATSRVGSSSLLSSTNNLTGRPRMREYRFDDDDVEMEPTDQTKWNRYELTIEVQSPLNQRWKRRTVKRHGSDIEKVVQRYFDINSHETMRLVGARFMRNLADF